MREPKIGGFSERLSAQAEARKALLAKMKPKPTVRPEDFETTAQKRERELQEVRARRVAEQPGPAMGMAQRVRQAHRVDGAGMVVVQVLGDQVAAGGIVQVVRRDDTDPLHGAVVP